MTAEEKSNVSTVGVGVDYECQTGKIRVKVLVSSGWSHHKARDGVIRGRLSWERSILGYKPIRFFESDSVSSLLYKREERFREIYICRLDFTCWISSELLIPKLEVV